MLFSKRQGPKNSCPKTPGAREPFFYVRKPNLLIKVRRKNSENK